MFDLETGQVVESTSNPCMHTDRAGDLIHIWSGPTMFSLFISQVLDDLINLEPLVNKWLLEADKKMMGYCEYGKFMADLDGTYTNEPGDCGEPRINLIFSREDFWFCLSITVQNFKRMIDYLRKEC